MAMFPRTSLLSVAAAAALSLPFAVHAEEGDYSWWQTLVNLVSPPKAARIDSR